MGMDAINNNNNVSAVAPPSSMWTSTSRRWRPSLASGLRAALACTIVGVVSVYAPPPLKRHLTFPAFSYVVTVIIVTDATVGTALRATASALHATVMGAVPSVLALWLAHRTGAAESVLATSAVVALSTFAVALPESPGPVAKRIALGQIIIIYVAKFRRGDRTSHELVLEHPANVVLCTALGVAAALLAVLLPCPRLATREVEDKSRAYMETAAERVRVLVDAFLLTANDTACVDDGQETAAASGRRRRWCMAACMSQANRLASASAALLRRMAAVKGDLQWERVPAVLRRWMPQQAVVDHGRIEMPIKGMEIALTSTAIAGTSPMICSSWLEHMRDQIRLSMLTTHRHHHCSSTAATSVAMTKTTINKQSPLMLTTDTMTTLLPERHEELSPFLFLFSMHLLRRGTLQQLASSHPDQTKTTTCSKVTPAVTAADESTDDDDFYLSEEEEEEGAHASSGEEEDQLQEHEAPNKTGDMEKTSKKQNKKSVWLRWGLEWERVMTAAKCAVSLGLAVLLGLLFNNDHGFWSGLIVATTMTAGRDSTWAVAIARAHGTAIGSVYGVLGCLLSQQPHLMELRFLALLPWIVLATFLKRSRAYGPAGGVAAALSGIIIVGRRYDEAPMAFTITRLVETFIGLSCTVATDLVFQRKARPTARARAQLHRCIAALRECVVGLAPTSSAKQQQQHKTLLEQVALLKKYAVEAGSEPNFLWLAPFPTSCYDKVHGSLSRIAQLIGLYQHARATLIDTAGGSRQLGADMKRFHSALSASLETLLEEDVDLEAGKGIFCEDMAVVKSFLGHAREALSQQQQEEEEEQLAAVCLGSIGFCMGEMMKEAQQLEAHMLNLSLQPCR
ncbi:uncharacterized protein [Aegilops tauschii subsp. strangulata]|uniref:Integral membrane bound transporter domain-containing protein n=1 Tax=Aegilops tauschii subsp. strangulata TaxID=200361 RepID=A0A453KFL7_AEGTS|nr:uncharacterized protein LOC109787642 [Aegilops tauschii subsp. strangulata]